MLSAGGQPCGSRGPVPSPPCALHDHLLFARLSFPSYPPSSCKVGSAASPGPHSLVLLDLRPKNNSESQFNRRQPPSGHPRVSGGTPKPLQQPSTVQAVLTTQAVAGSSSSHHSYSSQAHVGTGIYLPSDGSLPTECRYTRPARLRQEPAAQRLSPGVPDAGDAEGSWCSRGLRMQLERLLISPPAASGTSWEVL